MWAKRKKPARRGRASIDRGRRQTVLFEADAGQLEVSAGRVERIEADAGGPLEEAAQISPIRPQVRPL
jgi:hypothetical protein